MTQVTKCHEVTRQQIYAYEAIANRQSASLDIAPARKILDGIGVSRSILGASMNGALELGQTVEIKWWSSSFTLQVTLVFLTYKGRSVASIAQGSRREYVGFFNVAV